MGERKRRGLDYNAVDWRRSARDEDLPVLYPSAWAAIPDAGLLELYKALERAQMGEQP